jgi:hypothetical protein
MGWNMTPGLEAIPDEDVTDEPKAPSTWLLSNGVSLDKTICSPSTAAAMRADRWKKRLPMLVQQGRLTLAVILQ